MPQLKRNKAAISERVQTINIIKQMHKKEESPPIPSVKREPYQDLVSMWPTLTLLTWILRLMRDPGRL